MKQEPISAISPKKIVEFTHGNHRRVAEPQVLFQSIRVQASFSLVLLAALSLLPAVATAQSFRCKSDLVNVGDSRTTVLLKCGEPVVKDSFCKPVSSTQGSSGVPNSTVVNVTSCENVDEWTYNPGYGQFWTTLRFESGKLSAIKYGDRVK